MKKNLLLLSFSLFTFASMDAQENANKDDLKKANDAVVEGDNFNKWTLELTAGQAKGTKPYSNGYFSSNPDDVLGSFDFNSFGVGVRYMFSPALGIKLDGNFEKFENNDASSSKKFETQQIRIGLQGVVNAARLMNVQDYVGRFGLLVHAGISYANFTPKLDNGVDTDLQKSPENPNGISGASNFDRSENNVGVMFGISPQFRVTKRIAIIADFTTIANFRQHYAWDGHYSETDNNLSGTLITGSIGLTYSFGPQDMHGDWANIQDKKIEELEALDKRIGELETMMNDADKDGVPDYLDVENNSIAGVTVDSKGRMVDINKDGVPDELERYLATNFVEKSTENGGGIGANEELIQKLINDGYVTTYFDFNKTKPTNVSTEGIDFMLTYLRNNPTSSIDIIGNADEIGKTQYNINLADKRANSVKDILIKAGIPASRLNVISKGEDTSVDPNSPGARKLVRRVTFKVRN